MKRTISLLLALVVCLSLCDCGDVKKSAQTQKNEAEAEKTKPAMK